MVFWLIVFVTLIQLSDGKRLSVRQNFLAESYLGILEEMCCRKWGKIFTIKSPRQKDSCLIKLYSALFLPLCKKLNSNALQNNDFN